MAVLVTGTGFVGSYVVRDLLNAGEDVVLFGYFGGRGEPVTAELPDLKLLDHLLGGDALGRVKTVVGDISDLSAILAAIERHDVRSVVHLASMVTAASTADPLSAVRVNVEGTANVFEAAGKTELDAVAWASSISLFGPRSAGPSGVITDESLPDPRTVYGAGKLLCEQMARTYHDKTGVDITGLRLSRVYGFGEHVKAGRGGGSSWLLKLLHDPAVGVGPAVVPCGDFNLDFHYVEDVSDAFLRALRLRSGKGCAYLTHGDYRPVAEAFDFVRKLLPDADMTLEPGLPDGSSQSWSWRFDAGRAEADLGVRSRFRMEDGVYRTINQYRLLAGLPPVPQPEALSADLP